VNPTATDKMALTISRRAMLVGTLGEGLRAPAQQKRVPDRLVVLTFDDGPVSHATYVAPLLKKYGFGATFFVCEFPPHFDDKTLYMSWEQIASLHKMGFEVGNHTISHRNVTRQTRARFLADLQALEEKAYALGVAKMVSFAYPGYANNSAAVEVLKERGYKFARAGLDRIYNLATDDRYIIPSLTTRTDNRDKVIDLFRSAENGRIAVLTVHGVPDKEHPWVTTPPELFEEYLNFLQENRYKAIAMRDLANYLPV